MRVIFPPEYYTMKESLEPYLTKDGIREDASEEMKELYNKYRSLVDKLFDEAEMWLYGQVFRFSEDGKSIE